MQRRCATYDSRAGFSLLEILLALAIFGGAMAALSSLIDAGVMAAREATDLSRAQMLCESKLEEQLLLTTVPIAMPPTAIDGGDGRVWAYQIDVQPSAMSGVYAVRVTVRAAAPGLENGTEASYSLVRWVPDPTLGLNQTIETTTTETEGM